MDCRSKIFGKLRTVSPAVSCNGLAIFIYFNAVNKAMRGFPGTTMVLFCIPTRSIKDVVPAKLIAK